MISDNPYYDALPFILDINAANRGINLLVDEMNLPEQNVPNPAGPLQEKAEDLYSDISLSLGNTNTASLQPSAQVVNAQNQGSGLTTSYADMTIQQKIEYDKLMRGIA